MAVYLAIDIGGTNIKFGLVSENFELIESRSIRTQDHQENADQIMDNLLSATVALLKDRQLEESDLIAIGVGVPGIIINKPGIYVFTGNLPFRDYPFRKKMQEVYNCPIYLGNDANLAALAESRLGAGNGASDSVTLTLGTGMGAGVVINNRIYSGFNEIGCEFGHTVMVMDGEYCTCGRHGCFEAYVSATALIRQTKAEIEAHPDSLLAKIAAERGKVSGRTAFLAWRQGCPSGEKVVLQYTNYLAHGIANVINSYMPEVIIIGGGISNEGQCLIDLCAEKALSEAFVFGQTKKPKIVLATLGNNAGTLGAALFAHDCLQDGLVFE